MSPRPALPLNSYGDIGVAATGATSRGSRYKARARYRDRTGAYSYVSRFGQTKREAEQRLRAARADQAQTDGAITAASTVTVLAAQWLAEDRPDKPWSTGTRQHYEYAIDRYVKPQLGSLRVREASTAVCDAALRRIAAANGPAAARTARAVLNGMFNLAVRHELLTVNPIRETRPVSSLKKAARALTPEEADAITDGLRSDQTALDFDLPDVVDFMLATGCRIGETLAVRDVAVAGDTVEVNATIVRVAGRGLLVQERPKTAAGWRVLALPPFAVAMLERRRVELRFRTVEGVLFPSPFAPALRDPSNTQKALRRALDGLGFGWVTSHTFRKTVATRLDEAGWSARSIADQLGHAQPSMTLDTYLGRKVVGEGAAKVLER